MKSYTQKGFAAVEAGLIVVVLLIVAALGYVFLNQMNAGDQSKTSSQSDATTSSVTVESAEDLEKLDKELSEMDIDDTSDVKTLDSQSSSF